MSAIQLDLFRDYLPVVRTREAASMSQLWAEDAGTEQAIQARINRLALESPSLTFPSAAVVEQTMKEAGLDDTQ